MNEFTEFFRTFSGVLSEFLDYLFGFCVIIIIGAILLIELIKTFNPDINTPKEAVEYIVKKAQEIENEPEKFKFVEMFELKNKFDLLLLPLFGVAVVLGVTEIYPSYKPMMLEIISNYYISIMIYIAVFVSLYTIGAYFIQSVLWFGDKAVELFSSIYKIIKEEETKHE